MNTIVINYDLYRPGQDYDRLYEKIKSFGAWCHSLKSTWIVKTNYTTVQVRDALQSVMDRNDKLLVMDLAGNAAWYGLDNDCSNWLKNNFGKSLLSGV